MGQSVIRPSAGVGTQQGWQNNGGTWPTNLADENLATYVAMDEILDSGGQTFIVDLGNPTIPAGAQVRAVQVYFWGRAESASPVLDIDTIVVGTAQYFHETVALVANTPIGSFVLYGGTARLKDPTGADWAQAALDALRLRVTGRSNQPDASLPYRVQVADMQVNVVYNERPALSSYTLSQSGHKISWSYTYTDPENDPQERYRVKVFSGTGAVGDPETETTRLLYDSGEVFSNATGDTVPDLFVAAGYVVAVKAADAGSMGRYSTWSQTSITVTATNPPTPTLSGYLQNVSPTGGTAPASTPDQASYDVTGDLLLTWFGSAPDWVPATALFLVNRGSFARMYVRGDDAGANAGRLAADFTGTNLGFRQSTVGVTTTANIWQGFAVSVDLDNGATGNTVRFWGTLDGTTWTQIGADVVTAGVGVWTPAATAIEVGQGASGSQPRTSWAAYYDGATISGGVITGGVTLARPIFDQPDGTTSFVDGATVPKTWTISAGNGSLVGSPKTNGADLELVATDIQGGGAGTRAIELQVSEDAGTTWKAVRGSPFTSTAGMLQAVDDPDWTSGAPRTYRARLILTNGAVVSASLWTLSRAATFTVTDHRAYLRDPAAPASLTTMNLPTSLVTWKFEGEDQEELMGLHKPKGRGRPVVVSDSMLGWSGSAEITAMTIIGWEVFERQILLRRATLLYQSALETRYLRVIRRARERPYAKAARRFNVEFVEVDA